MSNQDKWMKHANDLRILADQLAGVIERAIPYVKDSQDHQTNERAHGVIGRLLDDMRAYSGKVRRMEKG